jgi:glycerol-3-phosphate acyltransferase PlsX
MSQTLTIAVDAMSGDLGAEVAVAGALDVLAGHADLRLLLVGRPQSLEPLVRARPADARYEIVAASEVVTMDERPQDAVRRKKDSSMRVAINLVRDGRAAACVSAGNTGALLATARFVLGMVPGIDRPAIVSSIPSASGYTVMLDLGANTDCTASHLVQFSLMGSVLAQDLHGVENPRVGLLNIGEEDIKGTAEIREAHRLLVAAPINYCGFVEGNDIFSGDADVVVTDGFTGNVALKTSEGLARFISSVMREEFKRSPVRKLGALAAAPALGALKQRLDPRAYNGATMVGLSGVVIKSHGAADRLAFGNAIRVAVVEARKGVPEQIGALVAKLAGAAPEGTVAPPTGTPQSA